MVRGYGDAMRRLREAGFSGSVYAGFSLIGHAGKTFFSTYRGHLSPAIARCASDIFVSPEVVSEIEDSEEPPYERTLRPLADMLWQLAGRAGTPFVRHDKWEPLATYPLW